MTIWKKATSAATSAALLASLLATAVAPAAFAANTATGGGTIYPNADASGAFSLTFAEDAVDQYDKGTNSFDVCVYDSTFDNEIEFVLNSPTVTRNLGQGTASVAVFSDCIVVTVNLNSAADAVIDSFTISGLKVTANEHAELGAVIFNIEDDGVGLSDTLVTASGALTDAVSISDHVAYTSVDAGSEDFTETGLTCAGGDLKSGKVTIAAKGVSLAETFSAAGGTTGSQIHFSGASGFTTTHPIGAGVTQQVCAGRFPSVVTVSDAATASVENPVTFQAGVNNQHGGKVEVSLGFHDALLAEGDSVTFTIVGPSTGVVFSTNYDLFEELADDWKVDSFSLSPDKKSVTAVLGVETEHKWKLHFDPEYDVALGVPNGTPVQIAVTTAAAAAASSVMVSGSPVTVGWVGYQTAGSTAAPTIFIGQNDQATGMITLRESAAGVIEPGKKGKDTLQVCIKSGEEWATGRYFWAVVTAGDLKFNVAGLPVSQAKMAVLGDERDQDGNPCLEVLSYPGGSTVASTIEIRDGTSSAPAASAPTNGPKVNVPNWLTPGQTYVQVSHGKGHTGDVEVAGDHEGDHHWYTDNIVIAVRAYTGTPTATVSGQLPLLRGMINQAAGSITFSEGAPNQFGSHYYLELCLRDPSQAYNNAYIWSNPTGANAPVVTTNSTVSGLIATFDPSHGDGSDDCIYLNTTDSGLSGLGTITISNLKLDVLQDAALGPVFVRIYTDVEGSGRALQATVSPAVVIAKKSLSIGANSALGSNPTAGYNAKTPKVSAVGGYVTWKFTGGATLANQRVNILMASKVGGAWTGPAYLKSAVADANGIVTVTMKSSTAKWINLRAQWPGSSSFLVSTSAALGAVWK